MERREKIRSFFNSQASTYAQRSNLKIRKIRAGLVRELYRGEVLDVGVSTGHLAELYSPGIKLVGMDISDEMIGLAKARLPMADLRVGDAGSPLPFADGSFDTVVASEMIYYLDNPGDFLKEIHRVLRKPGKLLLFFGNSRFNFLYKFLAKIGLRPEDPFGETTLSFTDFEALMVRNLRSYEYTYFGFGFPGLAPRKNAFLAKLMPAFLFEVTLRE